jgi:hypothetical protein
MVEDQLADAGSERPTERVVPAEHDLGRIEQGMIVEQAKVQGSRQKAPDRELADPLAVQQQDEICHRQ